MLQEQNRNLEAVNVELKRSNDLKQAFIQVASHELRTPLTILLGVTRLAVDAGCKEPTLRPWLTRIEHASQKLQHLVSQIVDMLVAGRFETTVQRTPTDMAVLLNQAADDVRPFIELRRQSLTVDLPADLGEAHVEVEKVRDSVNHLLLNAVKFTPDRRSISLSARPVDDDIEIKVADDGAGIDPACLARLFEPFFTGYDVSRHSSGHYEFGRKGIGLGLSVVKAFIQLHGGSIVATSEPGKGTTITLKLPRTFDQVNQELGRRRGCRYLMICGRCPLRGGGWHPSTHRDRTAWSILRRTTFKTPPREVSESSAVRMMTGT